MSDSDHEIRIKRKGKKKSSDSKKIQDNTGHRKVLSIIKKIYKCSYFKRAPNSYNSDYIGYDIINMKSVIVKFTTNHDEKLKLLIRESQKTGTNPIVVYVDDLEEDDYIIKHAISDRTLTFP